MTDSWSDRDTTVTHLDVSSAVERTYTMSTRRIHALLLMVSWMMLSAVPVRAESAEQLLQQGRHREEILGDLARAIDSYEKVLEIHARNHRSAARAQYRIGRCLEKMAALTEARVAYRAVLRTFSDQADVVRLARAALRRVGDDAVVGTGDLTLRLLLEHSMLPMNPHRPAEFDLSPDGERLVFRDRSKLQISGDGRAVIRPLADIGTELWPMPRWSPEGEHIAYMAGHGTAGERRLWIIDASGGSPRALGGPEISGTRGLSWTPDGGAVTCLVPGTGLITVDLERDTSRIIRIPSPPSMRLGPYSPDGRWLAASLLEKGNPSPLARDLWLVPAVGGRLVRLTQTQGFDAHPTWTVDGDTVYFVSSRAGAWNIWRQPVDSDSGRPSGPPRQMTHFSDSETVFPSVVGGTRLAFGMVRTRRSVQIAEVAHPGQARHLVRGRAPLPAPDGDAVYYLGEGPGRDGVFSVPSGGGTPLRLAAQGPVLGPGPRAYDVSPDGVWLAYGSRLDDGTGLLLQPATGGQASVIWRQAGAGLVVPRFSPDGTRLAFTWRDGLYTVPTSGGQPHRLALQAHWRRRELAWSPDGRQLAALASQDGDSGDAVVMIDATSGTIQRLTPAARRKEGVCWHPDGTRLTYLCWLDGVGRGTEIRQVHLGDSASTALVNEPFQREGRPAWSPDGRWLYYEAVRGPGRSGLWRRDDRDGSLALFAPDATLPRWSRDGGVMA
jgi:hypothetical protein